MGPRGFWIALAIVLFYLIARPHIGRVWYVKADNLKPLLTSNWADPISSNANPLLGKVSPSPSPPPSPLPRRYSVKDECAQAATRFEAAVGFSGAYCDSRMALLWGW
jgi:hypothetical protein